MVFNTLFYCFILDDLSSDMHYVNLERNPERYTGYKGDSALKVWKCIYQENCFKWAMFVDAQEFMFLRCRPDPKFDKNFLIQPTTTGTLEWIKTFVDLRIFKVCVWKSACFSVWFPDSTRSLRSPLRQTTSSQVYILLIINVYCLSFCLIIS